MTSDDQQHSHASTSVALVQWLSLCKWLFILHNHAIFGHSAFSAKNTLLNKNLHMKYGCCYFVSPDNKTHTHTHTHTSSSSCLSKNCDG